MSAEGQKVLQNRIARQKAFHAGRLPGDLLVFINRWARYPSLETHLYGKFTTAPADELLSPKGVEAIADEYIASMRQALKEQTYFCDDDVLLGHMSLLVLGRVVRSVEVLRDHVEVGIPTAGVPNDPLNGALDFLRPSVVVQFVDGGFDEEQVHLTPAEDVPLEPERPHGRIGRADAGIDEVKSGVREPVMERFNRQRGAMPLQPE